MFCSDLFFFLVDVDVVNDAYNNTPFCTEMQICYILERLHPDKYFLVNNNKNNSLIAVNNKVIAGSRYFIMICGV